MSRSIDSKFYKTKQWEEVQKAYMKSQDYLCERCKAEGKIVPAYIVHHRIHLNKWNVKDPSIAYGFDNLEALCFECHNKEHFGDKKKSRRYRFDEDGVLKIL